LTIRKGTVVKVELDPPADGEGGETKHRPAVVLVVAADETNCTVVGVSTNLDIGDSNYFVDMPYSHNRSGSSGNSKSGLYEKCVAKCYWYDNVLIANCVKIGYIPTKTLTEILGLVHQHESTAKANSPAKPAPPSHSTNGE
jgi:hypothetical protein